MSELTEITQTLHDPDNLRNDFSEAAKLVAKHFRKKYLEPMNTLYANRRAECFKTPSPQVALMQACKPFMGDTSLLDRLIDGMCSYDAVSGIMQDYASSAEAKQNDPSRNNIAAMLVAAMLVSKNN